MKVDIGHIVLDPSLPKTAKPGPGADRRRLRAPKTLVVEPNGKGSYVLLAGRRGLKTAVESGKRAVEVTLREDISPQERRELRLSELYHNALVPPRALAREFISYRKSYGITQQELARRTGITPGTIHHYESLMKTLDPALGERLDDGDLTFKEARSIADIDDRHRQREIAEPFLTGKLSSVHVEQVVGRAKSDPSLSIAYLIEEVLKDGRRPAPEKVAETITPADRPQQPAPTAEMSLEKSALMLAGELGALQLQIIPEYRRLDLISSLRILDNRLKSALAHLNSGQALESQVPRPLGRAAGGRPDRPRPRRRKRP